MEIFVYGFWFCFLSYIVGVMVGEHKAERFWRDKWWELSEAYMSEFPENFEDDPDDEEEEDESARD